MLTPLTAKMPMTPPPPRLHRSPGLPTDIHIRTGYGLVATGRTPEEAQANLMEKIRQAREN